MQIEQHEKGHGYDVEADGYQEPEDMSLNRPPLVVRREGWCSRVLVYGLKA
jgi:hypothetical protein